MNHAIFMDASAWIAIVNKRDNNNEAAVAIYKRLLFNGTRLITTNWTAYEALTLVKTRMGYGAATKLWDVINDQSLVSLIRVDTKIETEGLKLFLSHRDKTWGVTDCASISLMRILRCCQAFAFDEHFVEAGKQAGFEIVP